MTARIQNVNAPLIPDETHPFKKADDRARVAPIKHYYNVITAFYGNLAKSLHYELRGQLKPKNVTPVVYCCGYDWRQDNATSASRLSTIVDEAQKDCNGEKAVIVAHSMGGLVSRHYCKNMGGESKVRAMFLLGSPTLGAVSAYELLRNGMDFTDMIRRLLNISRPDSINLMRSMQSAYQLLRAPSTARRSGRTGPPSIRSRRGGPRRRRRRRSRRCRSPTTR